MRLVSASRISLSTQAVLVDVDVRVLRERELHRKLLAAHAYTSDDQMIVRRVVKTDAPEVYGELIFQSADHHLKDARQVLALPDGASDLLQQAQPLELRLELALRGLPLGDVVEQDGDFPALRPAGPPTRYAHTS
jgi:hypothetical protein